MIHAIKKEIALRQAELHTRKINSLYFGGGTPSLLSVNEILTILDEVQKYFSFADGIEITLEANPDDLTAPFLRELSGNDVNRLSIGTQSFFDQDLQMMNRAHTASEADSSIKRAQDFGFENISIDLIYGSPVSGFETWKENLRKTVQLQVPHVSAYALTVEPKTPLQNWINNRKITPPDENLQNSEFQYMSEFLKEHEFEHYEISNFGKPGFHSRHNSAYWNSEPYLGIGPSAHSYDGKNLRSWNIANNTKYVKGVLTSENFRESENLSEKDRFNEMIMIGLRTSAGVDTAKVKSEFSEETVTKFQSDIQLKKETGMIQIKENRLIIPEEKWFMADGIAADFFQL